MVSKVGVAIGVVDCRKLLRVVVIKIRLVVPKSITSEEITGPSIDPGGTPFKQG